LIVGTSRVAGDFSQLIVGTSRFAISLLGGAAARIARPHGSVGWPVRKVTQLRVEESGRAFPARPPAADLAKAPSLDAAATNGQI
jgi:hypothetical protein